MDDPFQDENGLDPQHSGGFWTSLPDFIGILQRLAGLFQLTEEEKESAGIFIGNRH